MPASFTIHKDPNSEAVRITRDHDPRHSLRVDDLRQLLQLRARINRYLDDLAPDPEVPSDLAPVSPAHDVITTLTARAIAKKQGILIPGRTLRSACERGHIPSAEKRGGRWFVTRQDFDAWLANYRPDAT